jgi:PAS domain-containing protein
MWLELSNFIIKRLPEIVGGILALLTLFKVAKIANRKWLQPCWKFIQNTRTLARRSEELFSQFAQDAERDAKLAALQETLNKVLSMMTPNGGSSLADGIHRLEAHAAIQSARQRLLLNEDSKAMFYTDSQGLTTHVTQSYVELVGRLPESILRDGWKTHVAESYRVKVATEWASAVQDIRDFQMAYVIINQKEQKRIFVEVNAYPALTQQGKLVGYVGIIHVVNTSEIIKQFDSESN